MSKLQEKPMNTQKSYRILGPCSLVFAAANTGSWRQERPVINAAECIRCGTCARACPADIITINKEGDIPVEIDWNYCKGCGVCVNECPKKCMTLVDERGVV